ncbi:MAG: SAM-dependent methyltransferase, partial [Jannaschia sp.]
FLFAGFLPPKRAARRTALSEIARVQATLVLYESPKRLGAMLADAAEGLGARRAVICRELTKRFEEVVPGTLPDLAERYAHETPKGEIVVLIDRADIPEMSEADLSAALATAMETMSLKSAVKSVSESSGMARKLVYDLALALKDSP